MAGKIKKGLENVTRLKEKEGKEERYLWPSWRKPSWVQKSRNRRPRQKLRGRGGGGRELGYAAHPGSQEEACSSNEFRSSKCSGGGKLEKEGGGKIEPLNAFRKGKR